jgi:1,4-alpha-glucan branching enzyme/glycosyltransferase involved in cell wall biosynthesis
VKSSVSVLKQLRFALAVLTSIAMIPSAWSTQDGLGSCIGSSVKASLQISSSTQSEYDYLQSALQRLKPAQASSRGPRGPSEKKSKNPSDPSGGMKVVMAAMELGPIPGLKTVTGAPLNISAGGVSTVLTDLSRYYPKLLREQNGGELTMVGVLMDDVSKDGLKLADRIDIQVDGKSESVGLYEYLAPNGTKYVLLDHPFFKRFTAMPKKGESIYSMRNREGMNPVDKLEEQRVWSAFNQAIAKVYRREGGEIYVPHDNHVSPASFYIHKHEGVVPISSKPLVHNEGYTGAYTVDSNEAEAVQKIWNLNSTEMNEYFMNGNQLIMLEPAVRIAEQNEIYTAISVADGSANAINQKGDFFSRVGALLNPLSEENRPHLSAHLTSATEKELRADGIIDPHVIQEFEKNGFAFGFPDQKPEESLAAMARAKNALQRNFGMTVDPKKPLFVSFARMVHQKGMEFVAKNVEHILEQGGQVIVGGPVGDAVGEAERKLFISIKQRLEAEANPNAKNFVFIDGPIKGRLKGLVLAGGDFFMIPSRYEPCGLTDVEALYHGAIPVARNTGGLNKGKNSILYHAPNADDQGLQLGEGIHRAFDLFRDQEKFDARRLAAMKEDFSVEKNFNKFLLNSRIEVYGKMIRNLDQRVVDGTMISAEARAEIKRSILKAHPEDVQALVDALNMIHPFRRLPLMDWVIEQVYPRAAGLAKRSDLKQYEFSRLLNAKNEDHFELFVPKKAEPIQVAKSAYQPAQGWRDIERDAAGHAVRGRFRFLADNSKATQEKASVEFYVVGDFNQWGKGSVKELAPYRLKPSLDDAAYLESDLLPLVHGQEYRVLKRERVLREGKPSFIKTSLTDPANMAYTTPGLLEKLGRPVHDKKNSVFWDVGGPEHYRLTSKRPDWRTIPGGNVMVETDILGLVKKWEFAGRVGPKSEIETFNFVADSGVIPFLADHGVRRVKFLPLGEHVEGEGWQWGYQTYPFAIDCHKGTPAEFARMVDEFNRHGIAVITDEVMGHFPRTGNPSHRAIDRSGLHLHTKEDGSKVYGQSWDTEWRTIPYRDDNPYVRRYKNDAVLSHAMAYGISGARIDNVAGGFNSGIYHRAGGSVYLREFNRELHSYDPSFYTNGEAFNELGVMTKGADTEAGIGFNSTNHGGLQNWIEHNLTRYSSDVDMFALKNALEQPYRDHHGARLTYLTNHDMADNGNAFPAQQIRGPKGAGSLYVEPKTKAFGSLSMLAGSDYQTSLQAELGQAGHFKDGVIDWSLLKNPVGSRLFRYWKDLNQYFSQNSVFNVKNDYRSPVNHVDGGNKVISFWRTDGSRKKKVLVIVNLGDSYAKEGGIENYRLGVPEAGEFKLALDSESKLYDGKSTLAAGQTLLTEEKSNHGQAQSIVIPRLAPFQVLVLEK